MNSKQRKALVIGCSAHAIQDGLSAAIYVLLPILAQVFGLSYSQVGLFKGVKSLTQGLLELSSGFLTELAADQTSTLLICLFVIGIGTAFQHAPASSLVGEAFAVNGRRGALGLYNSSGDVGKLGFAACFSLAIGAGIEWQQITVSFGLVALVAALTIGLVSLNQFVASPPRKQTQGERESVFSNWGILNYRTFTTLMVVIFLDNLVQAGVLVFVAFAMISKGAAPTWIAFGLLVPLGVFSQGSTSITYGLVPDLVKENRLARGYALMYSLTSFAAAIGPFVLGLLADHFEIEFAFLAMAVVTLLSALLLIIVPIKE